MCPSSDPDSEYNMGCILYQVSRCVCVMSSDGE